MSDRVTLPADTNQALGLAQFAIDFMSEGARAGEPAPEVLERTNLFLTDSVLCGLSALALGTNAPRVLREEALAYPASGRAPGLGRAQQAGATVFGDPALLVPEKAIVANCSAVREWDSNGTNFGYRPELGHTAGEFGHNDFYPVALAAAQLAGADGAAALRGMVLHDEIRGRLAEVFSLKSYKIDHVLHGAIASAAVFGAMLGANAEQIESAIGMTVAHYVPFRAIRAGKQLSDSKGASAAISTEAAILSVRRSMAGFRGPRDIFRNPEAVFRLFEGPGRLFQRAGGGTTEPGRGSESDATRDASPFELVFSRAGDDFTIMGMHFKIGLYEHQSAGAIQAMIDLIARAPHVLDNTSGGRIDTIRIVAYEPAYGIIGDPAKKHPTTRQSADHSMAYIVATLLRKALERRQGGADDAPGWPELMLLPQDYSPEAINHDLTRALMRKITFDHGGEEYDRRYPDGIPTSVVITDSEGGEHDSGLVMYPAGHARNTSADLKGLLETKFARLGALAFDDPEPVIARYRDLGSKSAGEIASINDYGLRVGEGFD